MRQAAAQRPWWTGGSGTRLTFPLAPGRTLYAPQVKRWRNDGDSFSFGDCCVIFLDAFLMLQALRKKGIGDRRITNVCVADTLENHKMDESARSPLTP